MTQMPSNKEKPRRPIWKRLWPLLWLLFPSVWCGLLVTSSTIFFTTKNYFFLFFGVSLISAAFLGAIVWLFSSKEHMRKAWYGCSYINCALSIGYAVTIYGIRTVSQLPRTTPQLLIVSLKSIQESPLLLFALMLAPLFIVVSFALMRSRGLGVSMFFNRALVYSILTISLLLVYFGLVAGIRLVKEDSQPDVAVVVSTLVAVAMFYPLRERIQRAIDRRFYRSKYDAEKVIAAFNTTLREEIDLDTLCEHLKAVVQETMHPAVYLLWLNKTAVGEIAPNDPLIGYALGAAGALDLERLQLDSPALKKLRTSNISLLIPLVSQGELVGLLSLGPHLSGQKYSPVDRSLLNTLVMNVAPALRVAQMVREQQAQVREHERIEQELRTARLIQHSLLPKEVPELVGWRILPYYRPAREVGGDFYDFLAFEDGRLGLVIGDVAGKGVPAALLMANTRSMLRTAAQREASPGEVLARVNELLLADMPPNLFVTCFYAMLDFTSGRLRYANAGQDLPYRRSKDGVVELRATGMPLGLLPAMRYEEQEMALAPGDSVLFYSDGLVEAHNQQHEMFSFPRLVQLIEQHSGATTLIDFLLSELTAFTGSEWEQEDDITLVVLHRTEEVRQEVMDNWQLLAQWTVPSEPGNERQVIEHVAEIVQPLQLPVQRLASLKTAVAEATMNAMEHGNHYQPDKPVTLQVLSSPGAIAVRVRDEGGQGQPDKETLIPEAPVPDLEAKLAGLETPRGWGLFLINNLVDELHVENDEHSHMVEMVMYRGEGGRHGFADSGRP